jgi:hypothetical protein
MFPVVNFRELLLRSANLLGYIQMKSVKNFKFPDIFKNYPVKTVLSGKFTDGK